MIFPTMSRVLAICSNINLGPSEATTNSATIILPHFSVLASLWLWTQVPLKGVTATKEDTALASLFLSLIADPRLSFSSPASKNFESVVGLP